MKQRVQKTGIATTVTDEDGGVTIESVHSIEVKGDMAPRQALVARRDIWLLATKGEAKNEMVVVETELGIWVDINSI